MFLCEHQKRTGSVADWSRIKITGNQRGNGGVKLDAEIVLDVGDFDVFLGHRHLQHDRFDVVGHRLFGHFGDRCAHTAIQTFITE